VRGSVRCGATLAEAKGSAVSHDQMVGCTPGVILPAFTTYPKHAREPPFCTGTTISVWLFGGAQNGFFCRRHPGECAAKFSGPELSRLVPRGIRAVCGGGRLTLQRLSPALL
jgi:hypothetical protein